jgi:hypothetical protein
VPAARHPLPSSAAIFRAEVQSVLPSAGGANWRERFFAMKEKLPPPIHIMPDELGLRRNSGDPFERCNLWLLYSALTYGIDKVRLITLWDGDASDGPGGTVHMYNEIKRYGGHVTWFDTRML